MEKMSKCETEHMNTKGKTAIIFPYFKALPKTVGEKCMFLCEPMEKEKRKLKKENKGLQRKAEKF